MKTDIIERIEDRNYECVAGFLQNDVDWIKIKEQLASQSILIAISEREIQDFVYDEIQQDWNDLVYKEVYKDGLFKGIEWILQQINQLLPQPPKQ